MTTHKTYRCEPCNYEYVADKPQLVKCYYCRSFMPEKRLEHFVMELPTDTEDLGENGQLRYFE